MSGTAAGRRRAFTLIELLVVVAIIAVLAGMLLPTLQAVRNAARSSGCQGKLRQIGMAFMMYANDTDGAIPPWTNGAYTWQNYVGSYEVNDTEGNTVGWGGLIYPNLGGRGAWKTYVCPSDAVPRDLTDTTSNGGQGTGASYSMAAQAKSASASRGLSFNSGVGNPDTHTVMLSQLRYPCDSCLIGDDTYPGVPFPRGLFYQGTYLPRHGDGVNALFCDAHVERVPLEPYFDFVGFSGGDYTTKQGRFWNSRR